MKNFHHQERNLFASVALFSELYDNNKDVYDIISEFIKAAIFFEKKWSFSSAEVTTLLDKVFDIKIPEAVVKTTLKKRLKAQGEIVMNEGTYYLQKPNNTELDISQGFESNKKIYSELVNHLIKFIEKQERSELTEAEVEKVEAELRYFLGGETSPGKYSKYISTFILLNENDRGVQRSLAVIKEGLILYSGIRYTSDLNELGTWKHNLTVFLDTEHLFNAGGLNGEIYEVIFNDFYKLIGEVNAKAPGNEKRISLKYFEENKRDIDEFFFVAEQIIDNKATLNPAKTAMRKILEGCRTKSDVIAKKMKFLGDLTDRGIQLLETVPSPSFEFNIVDSNVIQEASQDSALKNKVLNEENAEQVLRLFSKINTLRVGRSNVQFERVGYIILSATSLVHFLAHHSKVKENERDIPFATDIDFLTDRLWFKLKKGFGDKNSLPKSFDVVTKAQIVLSSQLNNSVSKKFNQLTSEYKTGKISEQDAKYINNSLRAHAVTPEEISTAIIDSSLAFLTDEYNSEVVLRQKQLLERQVSEGENAKKELVKLQKRLRAELKKKSKAKITFLFKVSYLIYLFTVVVTILFLGAAAYFLIAENDTILSILFGILSCGSIFLTAMMFTKKRYFKWVKKILKNRYRKLIGAEQFDN